MEASAALHPAPASAGSPIVRRLGLEPYEQTWHAMRAFTAARTAATPDELWLLQHTPVYTVGVAGRNQHLPRVDNRIPVVRTDRGGQITYHGPGQVVVYTLIDLQRLGFGVRSYVRLLENAVIDLLRCYCIDAHGRADAPGVYVDDAKIAALGLRIRQGRCYHGIALNVAMDLTPFSVIDPCGYPQLAVTDLQQLGVERSLAEVGEGLVDALCRRIAAEAA